MESSEVKNPESSESRLLKAIPGPEAVICRLSEGAASELARIDRGANRPPWSEKLFHNEFSNPAALVFGARLEGALVGFLVCHVVIDEVHILNFAIDVGQRRRGIGRSLLEYVLKDLHLRGVRWATLEVRRSNAAAQALYSALGFQEVGVRAGYYPDDQEDALVLSLNLQHFISSTNC